MQVFDGDSAFPSALEPDQRWKELILVFATFFLPGFLLQGQQGSGSAFSDPMYLTSVLLQALPQSILLIYIVQIGEKGNLENFGFRRLRWGDLPRGVLVCVATFVVVIPMQALLPSGSERTASLSFSNPALLVLVLATTMAAAYREEVFFRAYAVTRLQQMGTGPVVAIATTSIVFGAGHLYQGIAGLAISASIGLLMAAVFVRTRSLHALGIGHGLYNFIVLLAGSETFWLPR